MEVTSSEIAATFCTNRHIEMTQIVIKMQSRIGALICLVIVLYGCTPQKPLSTSDIVGCYSVPVRHHPITLKLNQDGSFEYKNTYQIGSSISYITSSGTWSVQKGNELILRSRFQPEDEISNTHQLTVVGDSGVDSTRVQLVNDKGESVPFVTIMLMIGDSAVAGSTTNLSGSCSLPLVKADSLRISHSGYKKIKIPYSRVKGKTCIFEMVDYEGNYQYRYFSDQKFPVKGNKILFENFWPKFGVTFNIRKSFFKKEKRGPTAPRNNSRSTRLDTIR